MKKFLSIISVFFFIFSCESESADSITQENDSVLVGTWRSVWVCECYSSDCQLHAGNDDDNVTTCDDSTDCNYFEYRFDSNGTGLIQDFWNCEELVSTNFEWTINNNIIELTGYFDSDNGTVLGTINHQIISLDNNNLDIFIEENTPGEYNGRAYLERIN